MHYIPKYSRERQNKRQSQKFVTVIDKIDKLDSANLSKNISLLQENHKKLLGFDLQK